MILDCLIDKSGNYSKDPVMILNFPLKCDRRKRLSDEEILKEFSQNEELKGIVITGKEDPIDNIDSLRSFIFSLRKFFKPGERPHLSIFTKYFAYELERKSWHGAQYELMYYGNAILNCGRLSIKKNKFHFDIIKYNGLQHS